MDLPLNKEIENKRWNEIKPYIGEIIAKNVENVFGFATKYLEDISDLDSSSVIVSVDKKIFEKARDRAWELYNKYK